MKKESKEKKLGDFNPLVVHERDPKTGKVIKSNPFKVYMDRGAAFYEWPVGSGNLYYANREPAGVIDEKGAIVRGAAHKPFTPPITQDEKIGMANATLAQENEKLKQELASIKKEQELAATHPKITTKGKGKVGDSKVANS